MSDTPNNWADAWAVTAAALATAQQRIEELEREMDRRSVVQISRHRRLSEALGMDSGYSADATIDAAIAATRSLATSQEQVKRLTEDKNAWQAFGRHVIWCDRCGDLCNACPKPPSPAPEQGHVRDAALRYLPKCWECGANEGDPCRTPSLRTRKPHKSRRNAPGLDASGKVVDLMEALKESLKPPAPKQGEQPTEVAK